MNSLLSCLVIPDLAARVQKILKYLNQFFLSCRQIPETFYFTICYFFSNLIFLIFLVKLSFSVISFLIFINTNKIAFKLESVKCVSYLIIFETHILLVCMFQNLINPVLPCLFERVTFFNCYD